MPLREPDEPHAMEALRRAGATGRDRLDVRIAALATRQEGVVSTAQLGRLGLTRGQISHRVRAGRLIARHRGVFAVGHEALSDRGVGWAAVLACGEGTAVGRRSALGLWGVVPFAPAEVHVTVARRPPRSRRGIVVHEAELLEPRDLRHLGGLPVIAPARALLDVAAGGADDVEALVAEAHALRLVTIPELERLLDRFPGARGTAVLRAASGPEARGVTRSKLERALRRLIKEAGLPPALHNHPVGRYHADALWPAERVIVEVDGWAAHGHRRAFERDRARDADLAARGYVVLRFTWRQVRDERVLVATRLARVLALRAAA